MLALHTWTLDTTPLTEVLRVARQTGWDAIELRRVDVRRAAEAGRSAADLIAEVRSSGLPVACVGVEFGWMWADGDERKRLLQVFREQCRLAADLGARRVMSPVDKGRGDVARAAASLREVGDLAAEHRLTLALEFNSQAEQLNALGPVREVVAKASHARCGLLLDTYHLARSGARPLDLEDVRGEEIAYVQVSDVPRAGLAPRVVTDRLPPGRGAAPIRELFEVIATKGYRGDVSYEAPNTEAWKRPADEVAREALEALRRTLPAAWC